jgi:hypothetical protein
MTANKYSTDAPRIYAACLASYNEGYLHGRWIDCAGKDRDELALEIDDMLATSPCPNVMRRKCAHCGHYQTDARPWSDAPQDDCDHCGETFANEFKPSAEEWAIHDDEGFCGTIASEWPDLADVAALAEALDEGNEDKRRGLLWLINERGFTVTDAIYLCDDVRTFTGDALNLARDYAYDLASETIPNFDERSAAWPFDCIDWHEAGRALETMGEIEETRQDGERFLVTNADAF